MLFLTSYHAHSIIPILTYSDKSTAKVHKLFEYHKLLDEKSVAFSFLSNLYLHYNTFFSFFIYLCSRSSKQQNRQHNPPQSKTNFPHTTPMNIKYLHTQLFDWYEHNKRILPWRETTNPYYIWISEVILQQTRVAQGINYYLRFIERFPDIQALASASEDEVLLYWQGLGYYSRARNLHKAARQVAQNSGSIGGEYAQKFITAQQPYAISKTEQDDIFRNLRTMQGVGEYTAGAIASFAFNLPYPALDGNVYRVLARLFDCDVVFDTTKGKKYFHQLAEQILDKEHPRLFNSAIMEFGALFCTPKSPDCDHCPIAQSCLAYQHNTVELLPLRKPRPTLRDRFLNYTIYLTPSATTLLQQRNAKDIWQHLYEFPLIETDHLIPVEQTIHTIDLLHVLSHQRLHARFHIEFVTELPPIPGTFPIELSAIDDYALSKLTLKAIQKLLPS